jgi:hypothetical protein
VVSALGNTINTMGVVIDQDKGTAHAYVLKRSHGKAEIFKAHVHSMNFHIGGGTDHPSDHLIVTYPGGAKNSTVWRHPSGNGNIWITEHPNQFLAEFLFNFSVSF